MIQPNKPAEQRQQLLRPTCPIAESYHPPSNERHYSSTNEKSDWITVKQATQRFPLGRTAIFALIKDNRIRSLLLRKRGNISGKRLISSASIADYIASHATSEVGRVSQRDPDFELNATGGGASK